MSTQNDTGNEAEEPQRPAPPDHPELGAGLGVYRPMRRKPSAYARLLLALLPSAALASLLTLLVRAALDRGGALAPLVLGGSALLVPFAVRVVWYRRHTRVEFRLYDKGLVAVPASGRGVVYPWESTAVFTDGWDRVKLSTPQGTVVTLGPPDHRPVLDGERVGGLRTRTVIRGAQVPQDEEWGPAILRGVHGAQSGPAADTVLNGGEVAFGDLVLSRDGLTVRRRRGRDDFTTWEDVRSLALSPEGLLMISSRGSDFPTHFMRYRYRIPNLEIFLDLAERLRALALLSPSAPAPGTPDAAPAPPEPVPVTPHATPDTSEAGADAPSEAGADAPSEAGADAPSEAGADAPEAASTPPQPVPVMPEANPDTAGTAPPASGQAPAGAGSSPASIPRDTLLDLLSQYLVVGVGAWAAWRLGTREEIDGPGAALLAVARAVLGGVCGMLAGLIVLTAVAAARKAGGEILLEAAIRWFRHRRYLASATLVLCFFVGPAVLLFLLFRAFPSRLVPLTALLLFGGWALLLIVVRCAPSPRPAVRHLPYLPGVFLVALACEQVVSGDVLTVAPVAGIFFPIALRLSWSGRRWMQDSARPTVRAAADVVLPVELGLLLALFTVWLANVLSFTPSQVTVVLEVMEKAQGLTEVHWLYWMAAYTVLAVGSYILLRWPGLVARIRRRLRPARLHRVRLPLGPATQAVQRSSSATGITLMVALIFLAVVAPVSEGAWKRPVEERYVLEVQRREYAEGAVAAYREIHRQVVLRPRTAARIGDVITAVHRIAPTPAGEPVNRTALDIARQAGRFQAGTLDVEPSVSGPAPGPDPAPAPESEGLDARLGQLDEAQRQRAEREERADRFAELASLAVTRALDTLDLGDNQAVQLVKEYLGGLVEDGPVKTAFHRWGEGVGRPPPEGGRLVRIDVHRLTSVAYERTAAAVERADAGLLTFYGRFGVGVPAEDASVTRAVELANQHRYLRQGTGPCTGCAAPMTGGSGTGGTGTTGGGGRR
ncbi:hypothetical protein [Streptomyces sp. NPDC017448]|uniref:hypothetical protein n=1 Tax=Streptomyces sp. NPDC017448 TaxID=3364996 RepID=UPI003794D651